MRKILTGRLWLLILTSLFATSGVTFGQNARAARGVLKGEAAISALGARLPDVAAAHGLPTQALTHLFRTQAGLRVDPEDALVFVCEGMTVPSAAAIPAEVVSNQVSGALASGDGDPFRLHSFPGASRVIYLDFNGHTTSGTKWNSSVTNGSTFVSQPFDSDGSPSSFGDGEQAMIRRMWQRVAEDYAPFAVDVTTEDPGIEALRRSSGSDSVYGVRVVISPTNWFSSNTGGIAYVGSFNWNSDTPCYVFTQQLANGEKYIAEAAAHEAGHTLGLFHDGATGSDSTEYYAGHGDWAPIMGVSYYRGITEFSRGEYANANNTENDLAVISGFVPYASDDHGNSLSTATPLSGPTVADGGTIESNADLDVFRFVTGGGTVTFNLQGPSPEPNLDLKAELLDANGQVLQSSDPSSLSAAISGSLASGTYYLRIRGVGAGNPLNTGYSNYGSVGNYVITGSISSSTPSNQPPVAVAAASATSGTAPLTVAFSSGGSHDSDGSIVSYSWNFGNGATSSAANPSYTYTNTGAFTATLTVTDNNGATNSAGVVINVGSSSGGTGPTILTQPVSQTVASGGTATFTVVASGSPTPTVRWYRDGQTWDGWTGSSITIYGATSNDAGTYTAVVTNSGGSVTSSPATLSIGTTTTPPPPPPPTDSSAPVITTQPVSQIASWGSTVTFSVAASGNPTPTVRWYRNGQTWDGWTGSSITISGLTSNDSGTYTAVVSNSAGSVTSVPASLSVQ
jgi:PKD repeat protein